MASKRKTMVRISAAIGGCFIVGSVAWLGGNHFLREKPSISSERISFQTTSSTSINTTAMFPALLPKSEEQSVHVLVVGDILLARDVDRTIRTKGESYPFAKIQDFLHEADILLGNLEGPFLEKSFPVADWTTRFSFPTRNVNILRSAGFTALNIANNHILDAGPQGVEDTIRTLTEAGISIVGSLPHRDPLEVLFTINGKKIGILGFSTVPQPLRADVMRQQVADLAAKTDFTIVTIHWGTEYSLTAQEHQRDLARMFIENGADTVIGHHPHVVQDIEMVDGKPVFYSLGNFLFDQYFRRETNEGLAVGIELASDKTVYRLYPLALHRAQPTLMEQFQKEQFLHNLAQRSDVKLREEIQRGVLEFTEGPKGTLKPH